MPFLEGYPLAQPCLSQSFHQSFHSKRLVWVISCQICQVYLPYGHLQVAWLIRFFDHQTQVIVEFDWTLRWLCQGLLMLLRLRGCWFLSDLELPDDSHGYQPWKIGQVQWCQSFMKAWSWSLPQQIDLSALLFRGMFWLLGLLESLPSMASLLQRMHSLQ